MDDIARSEFREAWLGGTQANLGGHEKTGTFSTGPVPEAANVISAKWVFSWKTDADCAVTKAKARLVARGFGQRFAVDYFETFAATPSMASTKLVMAVAVQEEWPLYHFDVTQAFIQAEMDTDVYMRLPEACSVLRDVAVKLENLFTGSSRQAGSGLVFCVKLYWRMSGWCSVRLIHVLSR
ncbi:unnamed protein product [Sphacelaria rigidula]